MCALSLTGLVHVKWHMGSCRWHMFYAIISVGGVMLRRSPSFCDYGLCYLMCVHVSV